MSIFPKTNISYALIHTRMCGYQRVRNIRFGDSPFCIITDELKINEILSMQNCINILHTVCSIQVSSSALLLIKHHFFVFSTMRKYPTCKLVMNYYDFGFGKGEQ